MPQTPVTGDVGKAGYLALSTTDSVHEDSPDEIHNRASRAAPALPPRSGSFGGGSNDSPSRKSSIVSTISNSSSSAPAQRAPARPQAPAPSASPAAVAPTGATTASAGPYRRGSTGAGTASGRGVGTAGGRAPGATGNAPSPTTGREFWMGTDGMPGAGPGGEWEEEDGADGLFHDAQDVPMPTLSVYDPEKLWEYVERPLMVYMPLRKLVAKPPAVSTPTDIEELPVRCLVHRTLAGTEVATRLVDSPAERYRAAFAFIYMVTAESQEHYKQTVRPLIREWVEKVESRGGVERGGEGEGVGGWLLLYVIVAPQGGGSSEAAVAAATAVEAQGKIFWWLCADFYSKTPGDRCALVSLYVDGLPPGGIRARQRAAARTRPNASPRHHPKQWSDLLTKVGHVVMEVFQARVERYVSELARIDASRGTRGWDFGKFFVMKESLALMYKELQLPSEALLKYQELAALILTMGENSEEDNQSTLVSPPIDRGGESSEGRSGGGAQELLFGLGVPGRPDRQPASVLDYGRMRFRDRVNGGRLRSLVLETQLYIFARQCALNLELKKPTEVARMGGRFMPAYYHELVGQAEEQRDQWGADNDEQDPEEGSTPFPGALDPAEVELFALKSSWDVVKACDRYFARVLNSGGFDPPVREMQAIRLAREETSGYLAELLEFAQTRLLEYARLVADRGLEGDNDGLARSCIWELHERGFLSSQRDWVPDGDGEQLEAAWRPRTLGRMRVGGGLIDVKTLSSRYFWDRDEEGEVFIPPQEAAAVPFNPIKAITGGDGAPSPTRPAQYSSGVTDFDDEEEDDEDGAAVISFFADDAPSRGGDTQAVASAGSGGGGVGGCAWLLDGPGALEDAYLQLTHSVAQHSERAGRRRAAARWWGRRAELLLERGEVGIAQARLLSLADLYQAEGWMPQAFWALHRLARCRRTLAFDDSGAIARSNGRSSGGDGGGGLGSDYAKYVSTVMRLAEVLRDPRVRSEGGKAAVERAAGALLRDVALCVAPSSSSTTNALAGKAVALKSGHVFGGSDDAYRLRCFAEVVRLSAVGSCGERRARVLRSDPLPTVHVGDVLRISCVLTSHLPVVVTLDSLSLEMFAEGSGSGSSGGEGGSSGVGWSGMSSGGAGTTGGARAGTTDRGGIHRQAAWRQKPLRRLESVGTLAGGDSDPSPSGSPSTNDGGGSLLPLPPPPPPAPSAITSADAFSGARSQAPKAGVMGVTGYNEAADSAAAAGTSASAAKGGVSKSTVFQVPKIRTTRSQSLSPRKSSLSASSAPVISNPNADKLSRVSSSKLSTAKTSSSRPGGSRSPARRSTGSSKVSPAGSPSRLPSGAGATLAASAVGSRLPVPGRGRSRHACSVTVEGPIELSPGENEMAFILRPERPGIITAARISATWAGVNLAEILFSGASRGAAAGGSATLMPPPCSVVVRPFRPRAELEVLPPSFLPFGKEGWVRVRVNTGPDVLKDARLRVTAGRGLAWGDLGGARLSRRRFGVGVVGGGGDGDEGGGEEPGSGVSAPTEETQPVRAWLGEEDSAEVVVDLEELKGPDQAVEISLRLQSTGEASRRGSPSIPPRSCTVKAELHAWHTRGSVAERAVGVPDTGGRGAGSPPATEKEPVARPSTAAEYPPGESEALGVECQTRARASVTTSLPFEAKVTVVPRPEGFVLVQAALICSAPVGLTLRSCDAVHQEEGSVLAADPNAFLHGELLPPGQPLMLAACVQRGAVEAGINHGRDAQPLAIFRLKYAVEDASSRGRIGIKGSSAGKENEIFEFDVRVPSPGGVDGPGGAYNGGVPGSVILGLSFTTFARPHSEGNDASDWEGSVDIMRLALAEPRAFDFGVEGRGIGGGGRGGGGREAATTTTQRVAYEIIASPSDWMISGLVKGSTELNMKDGQQIISRVHLVPIRGGLLCLPKLEVTAPIGDWQEVQSVVWAPEERKVLVLPPGETASVCKAQAP